ncbi:fumarylacetoacetate hydrolase family protein [Microbacterium jepli]|uniref:fumarylacetoacetate hydrolase family protein n=1 Tax=Microbacterium sp. 1P10UE TaxID=3132288 RepID=UPI0039A342B3
MFSRWEEFVAWAATVTGPTESFDESDLRAPVPNPGQVFAVGLNYRDHADESGMAHPTTWPPVFTKFPTSIVGPFAEVELPENGHTDWEVELVVVIATHAHHVALEDAWSHVAGVTVGQDLSERILQMASSPPQFSLGKSYPGFGPIGPVLVTIDELDDPDDLALSCTVNGETVQSGRTSQMIFSVPRLIANLSAVTPLRPGDIIFSGTPSGVGQARTPQWFLADGDHLVSTIEGIGTIRNRLVDPARVAR